MLYKKGTKNNAENLPKIPAGFLQKGYEHEDSNHLILSMVSNR